MGILPGFDSSDTLVDVVASIFSGVSSALATIKAGVTSFVEGVKRGIEFISNNILLPIVSSLKDGLDLIIQGLGYILSSQSTIINYSFTSNLHQFTTSGKTLTLEIEIDNLDIVFNVNGLSMRLSNLFLIPTADYETLGVEEHVASIVIFNDIISIILLAMAGLTGDSFSNSGSFDFQSMSGKIVTFPGNDNQRAIGIFLIFAAMLFEGIPSLFYLTSPEPTKEERLEFFIKMSIYHFFRSLSLMVEKGLKYFLSLRSIDEILDLYSIIFLEATITWGDTNAPNIIATKTIKSEYISSIALFLAIIGMNIGLASYAPQKLHEFNQQVVELAYYHLMWIGIDFLFLTLITILY